MRRRRLLTGIRRFLSDEGEGGRGQAMVEFAIAFPVQLFITFALIQLILLYMATLVVNFAVTKACRAAIVGGDPEVVASVVLAPISGHEMHAFSVDPSDAVSIPGWGEIRHSAEAAAQSQVYSVSEDDDPDIKMVIEHNYMLLFPVVDRIFAAFLRDPGSGYDPEENTYLGKFVDEPTTERVYGRDDGPFIRRIEYSNSGMYNYYFVIVRECTMFKQGPANVTGS